MDGKTGLINGTAKAWGFGGSYEVDGFGLIAPREGVWL